jgi:hypothetical protein
LIIVLAAAALGCLAIVLNNQYSSGNVYAEYSSQRTDRMGTAAIYEALSKVYPEVSRNEISLRSLTVTDSEILAIGLDPFELDTDSLDALEGLAKRGNRVVVALDGGAYVFDIKRMNEPLEAKWQVALVDSRHRQPQPSDSFGFRTAFHSGWSEAGAAVTRNFGKGSVVLLGSSWLFTNDALRQDRDSAALNRAIGNPTRILFDETHLGSVEQGTVMGLARQFRLQGVLAVALVCALLFIWQSSAPFPPERTSSGSDDTRLAAASAGEGLRNLLAHHIAPNRLMSACVAEWRKDRGRLVPEDRLRRIEGIAALHADPVEQWREIRALLDSKGDPNRTK